VQQTHIFTSKNKKPKIANSKITWNDASNVEARALCFYFLHPERLSHKASCFYFLCASMTAATEIGTTLPDVTATRPTNTFTHKSKLAEVAVVLVVVRWL